MPNPKRKLHFVEVQFDNAGNILPQKRAKQESSLKFGEIRPAALENSSPSVARQNYLWTQFTPIAPKPVPETPFPLKSTEKPAEDLLDGRKDILKARNATSTATVSSTNDKQLASLKPECSDWIQRVKSFVNASDRLKINTWYVTDVEHCAVSEKDLSRYDRDIANAGVSPVSVHIAANGDYVVKVFYRDVFTGTLQSERDLDSLMAYFTDYVICPGLKTVPTVESTVKRVWGFPFNRTDSKHCFFLHKPKNRKQSPGADLFNVCSSCKKLHHELKAIQKKRDRNGSARVSKSAKCNWKFLSPKSQKKRWQNTTSHARRLERDLKRLNRKLQVPLSPDFSKQMKKITGHISSNCKEELRDIFREAEAAGRGEIVKAIWKKDVEERRAFWKDQNLNSNSKYF